MDASTVVGLAAAAASAPHQQQSDSLLTALVAQLWPHINVAVCKVVKESIEPSFAKLPSQLKTLRFTQLDLGSAPIRIDNIVVHDKEPKEDSLQFDLDIVWDGCCNIRLKADYLGSFGVQEIKFHGRLSVLLAPIRNSLPVVSAVQVCFINPPKFELNFLGLANLADIMYVDDMIRKIIADIINDMLVLPNRMYVKMDPTNSFLDTYKPPIGVARVTIANGTGFQGQRKLFSDAHDVYCNIQLGAGSQWTTSTKNNCATPEWNETHDFVLYDYDQVITVHAWDEDTADADDDLGIGRVTVRELLLRAGGATRSSSSSGSPPAATAMLELHGGAHHTGGRVSLQCQVCRLSLSNLDSLEANNDENLLSGLITILVIGAHDIPLAKKQDAKTFVKVKYGSETEFVTGTVVDAPGVDALNPVYDCAFQIPLRPNNKRSAELPLAKEAIELQLVNGNDDHVLGTTTITHNEMVEAGTITERRAIGEEGASLEFRLSLCGVVQPNKESGTTTTSGDTLKKAQATSSSVTSSNAVGTVRLTILKGWGFDVEMRRRLIRRKDIPDIYCHVTFGSSPKIWKTKTISNSTTPEWNESQDYLLSDHGQIISIGLFDEDKGRRDKDDELGGTRIAVGKLLLAGGSTMDVELYNAGKPTGQFISLRCNMVESS